MNCLRADAVWLERLAGIGEPVEICDASGKVLVGCFPGRQPAAIRFYDSMPSGRAAPSRVNDGSWLSRL
jgi:hypothetical protein